MDGFRGLPLLPQSAAGLSLPCSPGYSPFPEALRQHISPPAPCIHSAMFPCAPRLPARSAQPYRAPPLAISLLVVDFDDTCTTSDSSGLVMQTAIEATVAQVRAGGVGAGGCLGAVCMCRLESAATGAPPAASCTLLTPSAPPGSCFPAPAPAGRRRPRGAAAAQRSAGPAAVAGVKLLHTAAEPAGGDPARGGGRHGCCWWGCFF